MDLILERIGLPAEVTLAERDLRIGDKVFGKETRDTPITDGDSICSNGFFLEKKEDGTWLFQGYTVYDGVHVSLFECTLGADGKLQRGLVNCFDVGYIKIDQGYFKQLLHELKDVKWDKVVQDWDKVVAVVPKPEDKKRKKEVDDDSSSSSSSSSPEEEDDEYKNHEDEAKDDEEEESASSSSAESSSSSASDKKKKAKSK